MKHLPHKSDPVASRSNEKLTTLPATGETQTYAALVKAHLPQPNGQPATDATTKDAVSALHNFEPYITQHLQLILANLDKQEKVHASLFSKTDRLVKATFPRGS
jgi:hypothetical protein